MKLNKLTTAVFLSLGLASFGANAQVVSNNGSVTFTGSIIDAPCSISADTVHQDVELGAISQSMLEGEGQSTPTPFTIKLENCAFEADAGAGGGSARLNNGVSITFTGRPNDTNTSLLALDGDAAGAGVVLTDGLQKVISLGNATPLGELTQGTNNIKFYAYLKGADKTVTTGEFTSTASFTLDYD